MEQETRNKLQRATQQIRRLLEEEFAEQLEGTFDILATGKILPSAGKHLDARQRLTRQKLVDAIEHIKAGGKKPQEAVEEYTREAAFTFLNRFVALRMLEARGLLQECVSKGDQSSGFREFTGLAPGLASLPDGGYRLYLECLFDELSVEVKVLFDRRDSASLLWPRRGALTEVLDILGQPDLAGVWGEDETIGWVYQYFNSGEERRKMRDESQAPRNSRELAVRNQFFTPRYVVEFLTDNTLGRIWYEMQKGSTRLADQCRYLVRRPMEFILPDPAACGLLDTYAGRKEMLTFWRSGNAADLLEDPSTAVVMDWVTRLANDQASGDGFETCLRQLGDTHDAVLERLFFSKQKSGDAQAEVLKAEHPAVLMHGIWRVGVEIARSGYCDMSEPISTHPEAGPCWSALRSRLMNPPDNLSQSELIHLPVFVPHRAKKDPRDLKILDPACGSGHFLLYAFDLLLSIYEEAWRDTAGPRSEITGKRLNEDYPELKQLHAALPGLVLAHNLHGIDIDPRATQIAALALWMRGQRAFNEFGISRSSRPAVAKSNIVCAEPMPGEAGFLEEFIKEHLSETAESRFLASLVRKVFESMKLAGEAGSLLKIEVDISEEVTKAKKQWLERPAMKQKRLFAEAPSMVQRELDLTRGITDGSFWDEAEESIYEALQAYSERAERIGGFQRRLFATDAARGFAFIDLCRQQYDVALMNPPFGSYCAGIEEYSRIHYRLERADILAGFISRGRALAPTGLLGAITNRTALFITSLKEWRVQNFLNDDGLAAIADLGHGVLDDALVEAAAYVLGSNRPHTGFNLLAERHKGMALMSATSDLKHVVNLETELMRELPTAPLAYWAPRELLRRAVQLQKVEQAGLFARVGLQTSNDFRFLRLQWEILSRDLGNSGWVPFAKGGEYSPFADNLHLCVNWFDNAREQKAFCQLHAERSGSSRGNDASRDFEWYLCPGLTYSERTTSDISVRVLPAGCITGTSGPGIYTADSDMALNALGYFCSSAFRQLLELSIGSGDAVHSGSAARHYTVGQISDSPFPETLLRDSALRDEVLVCVSERRRILSFEPTAPAIIESPVSIGSGGSLKDIAIKASQELHKSVNATLTASCKIDEFVSNALALDNESREFLLANVGQHPSSRPVRHIEKDKLVQLWQLSVDALVDAATDALGHSRQVTKKTWYADRRIELLSAVFDATPESIISAADDLQLQTYTEMDVAIDLTERSLGEALGAYRERDASLVEPDAFDPLWARCGWSNDDRRIGVLCDDVGATYDVEANVRAIINRQCDYAEDLLADICRQFGSSSFRDVISKKLFPLHIKRFSKSRRKAPIYWQLATPSASYSVWHYYHRFTKDTFFQVLNEYVKPKLVHERQKLERFKTEVGPEPIRSQRKELEDLEKFVIELAAMVEELERIAPLWNPNLNDGVIINFAPLWRLVPHNRAWQKECKACWDTLIAGEFDWSHLAMHLWPERVVPKCVDDASLAVAHGLDDVFWEQDGRDRFQPKAKPQGGWQRLIDQLVKERTSPAVKAALKSLLEAPIAGASTKSIRNRRGAAT